MRVGSACIRHMLGIYTNIRTKHPFLSQICRTVLHLGRSMHGLAEQPLKAEFDHLCQQWIALKKFLGYAVLRMDTYALSELVL